MALRPYEGSEAVGYMSAQVVGAITGSAIIWLLVHGGDLPLGATAAGANSYAAGICSRH